MSRNPQESLALDSETVIKSFITFPEISLSGLHLLSKERMKELSGEQLEKFNKLRPLLKKLETANTDTKQAFIVCYLKVMKREIETLLKGEKSPYWSGAKKIAALSLGVLGSLGGLALAVYLYLLMKHREHHIDDRYDQQARQNKTVSESQDSLSSMLDGDSEYQDLAGVTLLVYFLSLAGFFSSMGFLLFCCFNIKSYNSRNIMEADRRRLQHFIGRFEPFVKLDSPGVSDLAGYISKLKTLLESIDEEIVRVSNRGEVIDPEAQDGAVTSPLLPRADKKVSVEENTPITESVSVHCSDIEVEQIFGKIKGFMKAVADSAATESGFSPAPDHHGRLRQGPVASSSVR